MQVVRGGTPAENVFAAKGTNEKGPEHNLSELPSLENCVSSSTSAFERDLAAVSRRSITFLFNFVPLYTNR